MDFAKGLYLLLSESYPVYTLMVVLKIPDTIKGRNRFKQDARTGLCILLARLAHPNRLSAMALKFGWRVERVSQITNTLLEQKWRFLLEFNYFFIRDLMPKTSALFQYAEGLSTVLFDK